MPQINFVSSRGQLLKTIDVEMGTLLFDAARNAGLPVASSCTAGNVCGKCNLKILEGADQLSEQLQAETDLLIRDKKPIMDRISCMTRVLGNCSVSATYW